MLEFIKAIVAYFLRPRSLRVGQDQLSNGQILVPVVKLMDRFVQIAFFAFEGHSLTSIQRSTVERSTESRYRLAAGRALSFYAPIGLMFHLPALSASIMRS